MKLETKFSIGESVFHVAAGEVKRSFITGIFVVKDGHKYRIEGSISPYNDELLYKTEKEAMIVALSDKQKDLEKQKLYHLSKIEEIDNLMKKIKK